MRGNSDASGTFDINRLKDQLSDLGNFMIGWTQEMSGGDGSNPIGTSFRIPSLPWAPAIDEDCNDKGDPEDTSCIKVFTLFGVCGETFNKTGDVLFRNTDPTIATLNSSCNFE